MPTNDENNSEALLPYYVYELRDPRDNSVFYIGKGTNLRLYSHNPEEENAKGIRLKEIKDANLSERRIIIGRFETEAEAFAVESVLIKWVYGFGSLTNRVHGHRHRFIREANHKNPAEQTDIEGIDIQRRFQDGMFVDNQRRLILQNGVIEKLESVREYLIEQPLLNKLSVSNPDISRPQDPNLYITGFSDCVKLAVKMQLTGKTVIVSLIPLNQNKETIDKYRKATTNIKEPFTLRREPNPYAHAHDYITKHGGYPKGIPFDRLEIICNHIQAALGRLEDQI